MKIKDLLPISASIQYLAQLKGIPVTTGYKIARLQTQTVNALAPFEKIRTEMAAQFMKPGTNSLKEGVNGEEVNKSFLELLDSETDFTPPTNPIISLRDIPVGTKIVPSYLSAIYGNLLFVVDTDELPKEIPIPDQQTLINLFNGYVSLGNMEIEVENALTSMILDGLKAIHSAMLVSGTEGFPPPDFKIGLQVIPLSLLEKLGSVPAQTLSSLMPVIRE